jgi:small subunit ribosomal protein S11|tara:strand:- start:278 stop:619 length:342 start_codon:yes stop_codon:yes gene_type:complete
MGKNPIIYAKTSSNNSILSSQNLDKNYTLSCGCVGFNGAKRSSSQAAQILSETYGDYLQSHNVNDITIVFNGIGKGRRAIIKGFIKKNIRIKKIVEKTSNSHNGCRTKKKRRI